MVMSISTFAHIQSETARRNVFITFNIESEQCCTVSHNTVDKFTSPTNTISLFNC